MSGISNLFAEAANTTRRAIDTIRPAFAVSRGAVARSTAVDPLSSDWSLYDPRRLAKLLFGDASDNHVGAVAAALEKCGFNKAVRVREEVIRYKVRLMGEGRDLDRAIAQVSGVLKKLKAARAANAVEMQAARNILRLPQKEDGVIRTKQGVQRPVVRVQARAEPVFAGIAIPVAAE